VKTARRSLYVLDSFALLAYLEDEPGATQVGRLLGRAEKNEIDIWISIINYGEALYIVERERGRDSAKMAIATIDQLPLAVADANRVLTFAAAHIKAHHAISYADAFAVALAQSKGSSVVTGDPEFKKVESLVSVEWLADA
jgi:predicted nucleic acid-binding protein